MKLAFTVLVAALAGCAMTPEQQSSMMRAAQAMSQATTPDLAALCAGQVSRADRVKCDYYYPPAKQTLTCFTSGSITTCQ